jgi:single-strand DNA-binding protein
MPKSLNSVQLIGNVTRDPELRYTQSGRPVCDIGLATNRSWKTDTGEKKEEVDFHRIIVWGKLAEICGQYLKKGSKAYFDGRLQTRSWTAQDGTQKQTTEVVADDMIMLSNTGNNPKTVSDVHIAQDSSPTDQEIPPPPNEEDPSF